MLQGALSLGVQRCVQLAQCTLHGAHVLISRGRLARALAMHSAQAAAAAASAGSSAGGAAAMEEQEEQELYLLSLTLSTDFVPACLALACGGALLPGNAGMKLLLYLLGNAAANQLHQDSSGGGRSVTPATVVGPADGSPPQSVLAFGWTTATESSFAAIQGPVSFAGEARQVGSSDVCHARFSNGRVDFTCVGGHSSRAAPPVPQLPPGLAQRFMLLFARHGRRLLERPEGWLPTDRLRLSGRSGRGARMLRPELTEVDVLRELGCLPGTPDEAVFQAITKLNTPERLAVMAAVQVMSEGSYVGGVNISAMGVFLGESAGLGQEWVEKLAAEKRDTVQRKTENRMGVADARTHLGIPLAASWDDVLSQICAFTDDQLVDLEAQVYRKKPAIGHHYKRLRMKLAVACGLDKEYAKAALAKPEEEA